MLSYQHTYHAGNFADVLKHLVLTQLLHYMIQKDKPLFYLETHAGRGCYDLKHEHAQRTQEYKTGILPVWQTRAHLPEVFRLYMDSIQAYNPPDTLKFYPGSPGFALQLLRPQDRLYLCEAHPQEYAVLTKLSKAGKRVHFAHEDGWGALQSRLPPPERRGLILIDPSFEVKEDYQEAPKHLAAAYQHFPQGTYCLWYPMTPALLFKTLLRKLEARSFEKTLNIMFYLTKHPHDMGMYGAGLFIINPPFSLKQTLMPALESLKQLFHPGTSGYDLTHVADLSQ